MTPADTPDIVERQIAAMEAAYAAFRADLDPEPGAMERLCRQSFAAGYRCRPSAPQARDEGGAVEDIAAERRRQVDVEHWTSENDDAHCQFEMARAAASYAIACTWTDDMREGAPPLSWPWAPKWWKPSSRRRDLVKAAALLVAEIERLGRLATPPTDAINTAEGEAWLAQRGETATGLMRREPVGRLEQDDG